MKDYILIDDSRVYKLSLGEMGYLTLCVAGQGITGLTIPLTKHKCSLFSADIDENGDIHIAAVIMETLTYIKYSKEKTSTIHLMHLPEKFSITSVIINAENQLRLNYCVKSKEGSAIIEYTKSGENWTGKNVFTHPDQMQLAYVKKNKNECYVIRKTNNSYMLINAYNPEQELFLTSDEIKNVQGVFDGVVFNSGENAYHNHNEIAKGKSVYALDGKRIAVRDKEKLREYMLDNGARYSGEILMPKGAREYVLCQKNQDKKILLSSPFPYIKLEPEHTGNGGLAEEVYMQQRTLFHLQAEIKNLKARVKRLEDEQKFLVKNR